MARCSRRPGAPPRPRTGRPSTPSPSAPPPGAARRRWRWNRASRAARSCRSRAPPGRIPISMPRTSGWRASSSLPVAVALAAAAHGIALERALEGYLHAFTANLISAAVRTVPLGQSDGQIALAALEAAVRQAAEAALAVTVARRGRHGDAAARLVLAAPRDPVHAAVPLMTVLFAFLLFVVRRLCWPSAHAWWAMGRSGREASEDARWRAPCRRRPPPHAARPGSALAVAVVLLAGRALAVVVMAGRDSHWLSPDRLDRGRRVFFLRGTAGYSAALARHVSRPSRFAPATSTSIRRSAWRWASASSRCWRGRCR